MNNAFCTLFDHKFLPQGLALYRSLERHTTSFSLFILCVDDEVYSQLSKMNLQHAILMDLKDYETPSLLEAKNNRSAREYCWTLASHTFSFAKECRPDLEMITYVDADLFFFDDPSKITDELIATEKDILITEHSFAPEYQHLECSGRFCVQFISLRYTEKAMKVIRSWQSQCVDWCYDIIEEDRFGDQKYLDSWPNQYVDTVHVLEQVEMGLAPWNLVHFNPNFSTPPVFYHFQTYRIFHAKWARCFFNYEIPWRYQWVYGEYAKVLRQEIKRMSKHGIRTACIPIQKHPLAPLRYLKWIFVDRTTRLQYLG